MSPKTFNLPLEIAFINTLLDHTATRLEEVARERENTTPEAEFSDIHPSHSYDFEYRQVSTWFQAEEIEALRKTIQDIGYWVAEARAIFNVLVEKIRPVLETSWQAAGEFLQHIAKEARMDEITGVCKKMSDMSSLVHEALVLLEALIEKAKDSHNARRAKEVTTCFHHIAQAFGLSPRDIQEIRRDILDEQYWKCEVEMLKPYRCLKEYQVRKTH